MHRQNPQPFQPNRKSLQGASHITTTRSVNARRTDKKFVNSRTNSEQFVYFASSGKIALKILSISVSGCSPNSTFFVGNTGVIIRPGTSLPADP